MSARKYRAKSKGGGLLLVEALDLPAGQELEIAVLDDEDDLSTVTAMLAVSGLSSIWDDPEEDEAWKDL